MDKIEPPPPAPKRRDDGSYDKNEIDAYLSYFGSFGSQLAALRKTETKKCDKCGAEFTGLVRKVTCNKCLNTAKKRRYRDKLKTKNKVK